MNSLQTNTYQDSSNQTSTLIDFLSNYLSAIINHTDSVQVSNEYYLIEKKNKYVLAHADYLIQVRKYQSIPQSNSLEELSQLADDWDCEGAKAFDKKLIDKCEKILLDIEKFNPRIFPTARDSIQFEFHKEDGAYLEFEIYINRIDSLFASGDRRIVRPRKGISRKSILQSIDEFFAK